MCSPFVALSATAPGLDYYAGLGAWIEIEDRARQTESAG